MDDSRVTYTIGFYAETVKWDGSFHELKVRVAVPGVEVHSRSGYFALPDPPMNPAQNDQALIAQLALNGIPATGIGLHVRIRNSSDAHVAVELHLDLRELQMLRSGDHWAGKVRSAFLQMDSAGRILQADDRTFNPELDNAASKKACNWASLILASFVWYQRPRNCALWYAILAIPIWAPFMFRSRHIDFLRDMQTFVAHAFHSLIYTPNSSNCFA
jgi:hypothetical protein